MKETILQIKEFNEVYYKYISKLELQDNNTSFNLFIYDLALFWFYIIDERYKDLTKDKIKIEYKEASHLGFHDIENGHFSYVMYFDKYRDYIENIQVFNRCKAILKSFEDKYL